MNISLRNSLINSLNHVNKTENNFTFLKKIDKRIAIIALAVFCVLTLSYAIINHFFFKGKEDIVSKNDPTITNKKIPSPLKKDHSPKPVKPDPLFQELRQDGWFHSTDHIQPLALDFIKKHSKKYPDQRIQYLITTPLSIPSQVSLYLNENAPPKAFASVFLINSNHFVFTYINLETRTIEYYDSKVNYGDHQSMMANLNKVAIKLDAIIPGTQPFKVEAKIKKELQPDPYQCGPWVLYFLEQKAQNPKVNFNDLDIDSARQMIADYRIKVVDRLQELHNSNGK